ncbi:hypothetical protein CFK35_19225 [Clostridium sp. cpc1]|uniref:hypothetical protein n=1 Tax=Clostridium sp. cpc1 TaxID=2016536 RepID=UPI002240068A|nr:hypothetical protein [Clostridium sp. cpc1]MCW7999994.1 hypothetical protein [Clostridium sp. cpc1]MDU5010679.1 hypothetical protein [Clostridium botulinum]
MPRVEFVEKTIYKKEGLDVKFFKEKKDVRGDASLPTNYKSGRMTKNSATVSEFKEKLKKQFPGYDFEVYDVEGNKQRGNILLSNVRDTYVDEE